MFVELEDVPAWAKIEINNYRFLHLYTGPLYSLHTCYFYK